jgi:hypothetical protein
MRLSTAVCLSLVLVGLTSGCTMMRNPLASKADPQDATRRRMIAEMSVLTGKGDIEGARQILARLEASDQAAKTESTEILLGTRNVSTDPDDVNRLVDRLVAFDPPALREANRQKYQQFSPSTLKLMLTEYDRTATIGQQDLNQFDQRSYNPGMMYAQNSSPVPQSLPDDARPTVPGTGLIAQRSAPDPRPAGSQPLGTQSPWPATQREAKSSAGAAPRLPNANNSDLLRNNGAAQGGGLQTVSGELPVRSGITGSAPGPATLKPFGQAGQLRAPRANELPIISPGNSGLQNPITPIGASISVAESGTAPISDNGGVSLLNQISPPADDDSSIASSVFNNPVFSNPALNNAASSGAFPTVATSQSSLQFPDSPRLNAPVPGDPISTPLAQPGLPGVLETGVQGVQQIIPRIKDVAGRTLRNFGQGESPLNSDTAALPVGQADVPGLIRSLEAELLSAALGQTEAERLQYIRKHVNLRMLHLVAGDVGQAVEPIPGIASADQEFWQQMIWSMSNYFDDQGMPDESVRSAETIEQLRGAIAQLGQTADLKLRNTTFCHRIVSFGSYERFREDRFTTGQPVLLYAEVGNFTSLRSSNDGYRTVLQSAIEIYRAGDLQNPVATIPLSSDTTEDFCRAQRRDYFHSYEFSIPPKLEPGLYTLLLSVVDQQSRKVATSRVNFEVE